MLSLLFRVLMKVGEHCGLIGEKSSGLCSRKNEAYLLENISIFSNNKLLLLVYKCTILCYTEVVIQYFVRMYNRILLQTTHTHTHIYLMYLLGKHKVPRRALFRWYYSCALCRTIYTYYFNLRGRCAKNDIIIIAQQLNAR